MKLLKLVLVAIVLAACLTAGTKGEQQPRRALSVVAATSTDIQASLRRTEQRAHRIVFESLLRVCVFAS